MRHFLPAIAAVLSIGAVIAVPFVGAAPASAITTINGVPLCDGQNGRPAHDPTQWHPLLAYDAKGAVLCTFGHEHGMNPALVDNVFGATPLSNTISYPWATVSAAGVPENGVPDKHRVYKWIVAPSLACS